MVLQNYAHFSCLLVDRAFNIVLWTSKLENVDDLYEPEWSDLFFIHLDDIITDEEICDISFAINEIDLM